MLYWGHHGVLKDAVRGVKWFERSALQMKDPSAMYDYSILLMKVLWPHFIVDLNTGCFVFLCFDAY